MPVAVYTECRFCRVENTTISQLPWRGRWVGARFRMNRPWRFTASLTGVLQAGRNQTVDIVLASLLILGGIVGAQFGARASSRFRAEELRAILAIIVLIVGLRMGMGLFLAPEEPFVLLSGAIG